ncbi:putative 3',5'-cyclic-nucleotide phosphodiesterase [Renibacterium salmoninarum ATCC 33209]|uniref:Putative 3',5'-cyclic-nucleotide phosphodiesterase n=1 Tax=Renibacterium salmoninarum (strain ATCC 33209 / DSM 20767 / JCM 11484 / NBRC 15589 / NCIMB 2235) TaxID=288705 RepID=A9WNR5_RENSM|nr:metallophosphoesterase [Renibacterium salmoninarum]ABY23264.1 putative 3',5'-cyclic-nucleotide phosphodiesterase [Renibacterium salmoninarum ATCC 33209]
MSTSNSYETLSILHLSDTHVLAKGLHSNVVDTRQNLLEALRALVPVEELDLVVVSGDVSDDGTAESYRMVQELVENFASHRGARAIYTMGNHDGRPGFWEVLGNGHPDSPAEQDGGQLPVYGSSVLGGFRIISLDTSVPGRTHGYLDRGQLDWLTEELGSASEAGTVLVLHHPPVEPVTPLHDGIELQNPEDLLEVLHGSDVRLILSGHYHHGLVDSVLLGDQLIPVLVAPGIVNVNDVLASEGHERALRSSGAQLHTLFASAPTAAAARVRSLPLNLGVVEELFDLGPEELAEISARISARPDEGSDG